MNNVEEYVIICSMNTLKKNDIFTVTIDGYGSEAQGVCHIDGRAVFVPRTLPGEVWEIRILKVTNSAVYAKGENCSPPPPAGWSRPVHGSANAAAVTAGT